jgi:Ca2+/Na+ antiporter
MMKYIKDYESWLSKELEHPQISANSLLLLHEKQIGFVQHERLIHLLVTLFTGIMLMFFLIIAYVVESVLVYVLLLLSVGLFVFYLIHYGRLENAVQHWYEIYEDLWKRAEH